MAIRKPKPITITMPMVHSHHGESGPSSAGLTMALLGGVAEVVFIDCLPAKPIPVPAGHCNDCCGPCRLIVPISSHRAQIRRVHCALIARQVSKNSRKIHR